jgi:hypothetical protein
MTLTQFGLTAQEIKDTEELAAAFADGMTNKQLFTMMGNLNAYAWRAAINYKSIYIDGEGKTAINLDNWNNLLSDSLQGKVEMMVAIKFVEKYLKEHWKGAHRTRPTNMVNRDRLMSLGLFWYDRDRPEHTATPPILQRVDFPRMLICYRVFDRIRRDRINAKLNESEEITAFDCMPQHGGMTMVTMYNALFFSRNDYQGNYYGDGDIVIEATEVTPPPRVRWKYPKIKGLCRAAWEKLVIKAGQIYDGLEQQLAINLSQPTEPIGDLALVPF